MKESRFGVCATNHGLDSHLEQARLGRVELVEQSQRLVHHLVILVV